MPAIRGGGNSRRRVRAGDENNSVRDWQCLGKDLLRQRCREYGLLATGKLGALAVRLFDHFIPPDPTPELPAGILNMEAPEGDADAVNQDQEGQIQQPNQEAALIQAEVARPAHDGGAAFEVLEANKTAAPNVDAAMHEGIRQVPDHAANDALLVSREDLRRSSGKKLLLRHGAHNQLPRPIRPSNNCHSPRQLNRINWHRSHLPPSMHYHHLQDKYQLKVILIN